MFDKSRQFPNEGDWMEEHLEDMLPEFETARFRTWLNTANSLPELMQPPLFKMAKPPVVKEPVVVNSVIVDPPKIEKSRVNELPAKQADVLLQAIPSLMGDSKPPHQWRNQSSARVRETTPRSNRGGRGRGNPMRGRGRGS
jgi:hypothetical protein